LKVALAVGLVNECSSKISMDIQCFSTSCDKPQIHCNVTTTNKTALDNFLEVKLDMDELCQFSNMLICPYVKEVIKNLITKLSQEGTSLKKNFNITNKYSANGSRKKGLRAKITMYNTKCHNLMRVFMYKKAYGAKDNKKN